MSPTSGIANGSLIEAIWTCYTFDILYIRCFANPAKWRNSDFPQRSMDHETFDLNFSKVHESLSFPLIVRVIPFFKNIFKSAAEMISFKNGSRGLNWNNLWAYIEFIQRWTICHPEKTDTAPSIFVTVVAWRTHTFDCRISTKKKILNNWISTWNLINISAVHFFISMIFNDPYTRTSGLGPKRSYFK